MVLIEGVLISDDLFESRFMCDLERCRGACCWEGDFGAPLSAAEQAQMGEVYKQVKDVLPEASRKHIEQEGPVAEYDDPPFTGTALMPDGACAFLAFDNGGIARCGIEMAWAAGNCTFQKPVSCQLYPVRIEENEKTGFVAMNYDRWEICNPACRLGEHQQMPLFRFVRQGIIRRFGQDFYEQMEAYYRTYYHGQGE